MDSKPYFDDVAQQWDAMRQAFFSDNVRAKAFAAAGLAGDGAAQGVAADLGAGTGFIVEGLVQRGVRVIAVDQSEEMLGVMRRKFEGRAGIDYRRGDAEHLPIDDASVDFAFANMYLHHVESPAAAIREMARILKSGGRLAITDLDEHRHDFLRTEHHDRWMGFKREEVRAWLAQAGLADVNVDCAGESCCADSACGGERASVNIFVASGLKTWRELEKQQMSDDVFIPMADIHNAVRSHYAESALQRMEGRPGPCCGGSSGGPSCCSSGADLAQLPAEVVESTWGCGDPVSLAALQPGQRVLDLGSGGGLDCLLAAQRVGEGGWVIGVDMTPEMLSLAWRNAAKAGLRNVEFRYGHIEHLPVESGSIDVILSNCVINLSPDKPAVFREAFRVLKPGGKFAVSDIVADGEIPASARADLASLAACVSGAIPEADYLAALRAAGFEDVRVVDRHSYAPVPGSAVNTWSVRVEAYKAGALQ